MESKQLADEVSKMLSGDPDAFDHIVHSLREQALRWAVQIVRDPHLAEDIVQESFLLLRQKIGTLQDPGKLQAWFKQIVRRVAMNQIRGLARKTLLIDDVEVFEETTDSDDPLQQWLNQEHESDMLQNSLLPLTEQARTLLTTHALEDAPPEQLAERFNMKKSNVYNILSRSRLKANDERFRHEVDRYLAERRRLGHVLTRELPPPRYDRPYALMSILIAEVLRISGEPNWSFTELMGISGDAFRLNMPTGCSWQGISTFDWSYSAYRTLEHLGFSGTCFGRPGRSTLSPEQQITVLSTIQETIDRGLPAIIWNLEINQFGFVYGYNDEDRTILYRTYDRTTRTYQYEHLGRSWQEPALFVMAIKQRVASPVSDQVILHSIIQHARGREPRIHGFEFGLQGYPNWLAALDEDRLDLHGHAFQVAIMTEARQQGAKYLEGLSENTRGSTRKSLLKQAADCYMHVSEAFTRLYPSFPFGYGGNNTDRTSIIRDGLQIAYEAEQEAIFLLESYLRNK